MIAERNAEAAAAQVEVTQDTAKRQLRAYVFVERVGLNYVNGRYLLNIEWKNSGQTPAYELNAGCEFIFSVPEWRGEFAVNFDRTGATKTVLGPGAAHQIIEFEMKPGTVHGLWATGKRTLFVFAETRYFDCFGQPRSTKNRYRADWREGDQIHLIHEDIGNEST